MKVPYISTLLAVVAMVLTACGAEAPPSLPQQNAGQSADAEGAHKVFINVGSSDGLALRQVAVDSVTYDVVCDEYEQLGLTTEVALIYDGSTNCTIRLKNFSLETGRLYVARPEADFSNYAPGEVAIFDSGDLTLYVIIETQLPAQITAPSDVKYKFSEINNFEDLEAQKKVQHGVLTMLSGDFAVGIKVHPPVYTDNSIEFVGECMNEAIVGTDISDATCQGDALAIIQLAFEPYPANTDRVTLSALTANASDLSQLSAELVPHEAGVTNGGFRVTLPFDATDLQDRILILHARGSMSYLFGKIMFNP